MEQSNHADLKLDLGAAQRHVIRRPRLTKLLDEADGRIILLVAPAGYGKTELAREWTSLRNRRGLWYRAREGASDVAVVARSVSRALAPLSPTVERSTRELLSALNTPEEEPEAIAYLLAEELEAWPSDTWLVIDEYELVIPHAAPVKLIEHFVQISGARVLITSRERPTWITARDLLYGEGYELGAAALSMTVDEATQVLESAPHAPAGLVALANGWPAVIGLAALLPHEAHPTSDGQSALFDYVAQELFDALDADVQRHLVLLAVPSTLDPNLVQSTLGADTERVLHDSIRAGLMTLREGGELEIHPLCRAFLERKLWDVGVSNQQIDALAMNLIEASRWDDAFELIRRFDLPERLPVLIERGLRRVLGEGRLAAVVAWVDWADEQRLDGPELALARAEIFLRRGQWELSASLAATCAQTTDSVELAAQAHLCAGGAAHLLDHVARAWAHYGQALATDASAEITRRALWGRFVSTYWTSSPDYRGALEALEEARDTSPAHFLRLRQAKLVVAERDGYTPEALASALAAAPLLAHVEDPFVRSGFLNSLGRALSTAARYSEAETVLAQCLDEARRFHLNFAVPSALMLLGSARLGLGGFTAAAALVDKSEREDKTNDPVVRVKREVIRASIALSRGAGDVALAALRALSLDGARTDMIGEAFAIRALAEVCYGDQASAEQTLSDATPSAVDVSPQVLLAATAAIVAIGEAGLKLDQRLDELASTVTDTGCYDSVICAFRSHSGLLEVSTQHSAMREIIRVAGARSGDEALNAAIGAPTAHLRPKGTLSKREVQVLQLVAEGFRNDEIGQRLFISSTTVKTHLQNVYEKLDVTSRTQAAMKAREEGLLR